MKLIEKFVIWFVIDLWVQSVLMFTYMLIRYAATTFVTSDTLP